MRISVQTDRRKAIDAAMGRIPCDVAVTNAKLVNVVTGEIYPADVYVSGDLICAVSTKDAPLACTAATTYDAHGAYLVPGFIDTHIHVESTMMTPDWFASAVLVWGTTTIISDPHEIANVMGKEGVLAMVRKARRMPLRHFLLAPSCVPSNPPLEKGGAVLGLSDIESLLKEPEIIGLGEVMDYRGVVENNPRMAGELSLALRKQAFIQGHAPMLDGQRLDGYIASGVVNDHECRTGEECIRKLRLGMHINLKSSSLSNNLQKAIQAIKPVRWKDHVSFCTDDLYAETILEKGHLNKIFGEAVSYGLDPIDGVRFASYNASREYGLEDLGVIAPGFVADFQILPDLNGCRPTMVFVGGRLVARDGRCLVTPQGKSHSFGEGTLQIPDLPPSFFTLKDTGKRVCTLDYKGRGGHFHSASYVAYPAKDGLVDFSSKPEVCLMAVINRYGKPCHAMALFAHTGLVRGAYATTVSHDCHNILVFSRNPDDAALAVAELKRIGGGFSAALQGKVLGSLPLPVGGLMVDKPVNEVGRAIKAFEQASSCLFDQPGNVLRYATSALPVLPGFVVTDEGIVDGVKQRFVPLYES